MIPGTVARTGATMAEKAEAAEAKAGEKGLVGKVLGPLVLIIAAAAAGAGGAYVMPMLAPQPGATPKPPAPKIAPLEYIEIDNSFTSNLRDTGRFVQIRVAISTQGGTPVVEAVDRHRVAIISAVLGVLAETGEAELNAPGGREELTRKMRIAINDVLQRKSGVAGIDDVFLTSFVLQ